MKFLKDNSPNISIGKLSLLKGEFIISTPIIKDPLFERQIIFISESQNNSAYGFFIDFHLQSTDILASTKKILKNTIFNDSDLYLGGPIATETVFVIHSSEVASDSTYNIIDEISVTPLDEALNFNIKPEFSKIIVGYCEWHSGQLEREIKLGYWITREFSQNLLFQKNANKWNKCLMELGMNPMVFDSTIGLS